MTSRFIKSFVMLISIFSVVLATTAQSKTFVSFNGGFYFDYPDDWEQVDYHTADAFLTRMAKDNSMLGYEAVFAPKESSPFFATDYLILSIEKVDWLYDYKVDSIVNMMKKSFGKDINYFPAWDRPGDVKTNEPYYDKENRMISVVTDIVDGDKIIKKSFLVRKFHDKGIADFYFFAPDSTFEKSLETFHKMVASFGTENVDAKIPKEKVDVAKGVGGDQSISATKVAIPIGIAIVIVLIIVIRSKKKRPNLNT